MLKHYRVKQEMELLAAGARDAAKIAHQRLRVLPTEEATYDVIETISGKMTRVSLKERKPRKK